MQFIANITIDGAISAIATITSPIVAIWITESFIRRRNRLDQQKSSIIEQLIANRSHTDGQEFMRAFNSILLFFGKDQEVSRLTFRFRDAAINDIPRDAILTELLHKLCVLQGHKHLSLDDIKNVFKSK